jgi:hypothetical protein
MERKKNVWVGGWGPTGIVGKGERWMMEEDEGEERKRMRGMEDGCEGEGATQRTGAAP